MPNGFRWATFKDAIVPMMRYYITVDVNGYRPTIKDIYRKFAPKIEEEFPYSRLEAKAASEHWDSVRRELDGKKRDQVKARMRPVLANTAKLARDEVAKHTRELALAAVAEARKIEVERQRKHRERLVKKTDEIWEQDIEPMDPKAEDSLDRLDKFDRIVRRNLSMDGKEAAPSTVQFNVALIARGGAGLKAAAPPELPEESAG